MLIVSIEKNGYNAKKYKVRLEGEADLCLYAREIKRFGMEEGGELSPENYETIVSEVLIPRAKQRALHLLGKQDRTEANLRKKLAENGYPPIVVDEAVSYVASYHYIDDTRYASNYVFYHKDDKSRRRIMQDLLAKGIDKDVIELALEEEYSTDERMLIHELLRKKNYVPENADRKERAKMYRFLASRGFSASDISDALRSEW